MSRFLWFTVYVTTYKGAPISLYSISTVYGSGTHNSSVFIITAFLLYIVLLRVSFMSVVLRRNNKR